MQRIKLIWLTLLALAVMSLPVIAQTQVQKEVIPAAGGKSGNGQHQLISTVGQPCVGNASSAQHGQIAGFLAPGVAVVSGVEGFPTLPLFADLGQNFPNPFSPVTTIRFDLPNSRHVRLEVFSMDGRRITALIDKTLPAGRLAVVWDGKDARGRPVPSGAYLYRLKAGDYTATHRMLLTR